MCWNPKKRLSKVGPRNFKEYIKKNILSGIWSRNPRTENFIGSFVADSDYAKVNSQSTNSIITDNKH